MQEMIKNTINQCLVEYDNPIKRHNDYKHFIHKICFLADMDCDPELPGMKKIADLILSRQSDDGFFLSNVEIAKAFKGTGFPEPGWLMCDFPLILYFLIKTGYKGNPSVKRAVDSLQRIADDNGWKCKGYHDKFRGPGKKADHCPLATLYALKVFSLLPEFHKELYVKAGIDSLLYQWSHSYDGHIYMFGMGKRFRKLKYPNHWFDVLHVVSVLSNFDYARRKPEYKEMIEHIKSKRSPNGGFIPESIYLIYKGLDFGQKKAESQIMTKKINQLILR